MGKENLYVWEYKEGMVHENEAALVLKELCENEYMSTTELKEGKVELIAEVDGFFQVDVEKLNKINNLGELIYSVD